MWDVCRGAAMVSKMFYVLILMFSLTNVALIEGCFSFDFDLSHMQMLISFLIHHKSMLVWVKLTT